MSDSSPTARPWPRVIILVDMNAFFASIEQLDNPEWRGRPLAVTNGRQGSCIITSSYEARADGVRTGMRLREARHLCPGLIQAPSRPGRYAAVSTAIMSRLETISPDIEVFSVDEAFLDVTRCQRLLGTPEQIARRVKRAVFEASGGLLCSVGVSGDKTTAKYAAKLDKPDGLTLIPPWEAAARLHDLPPDALCGIGRGIGRFLATHGVQRCGDMARLPISVLAGRYGNPGRRIWYMAQGCDPALVTPTVAPPKSIGHGKVIPPDSHSPEVIQTYLLHMCEKVATRLRRHGLAAGQLQVGLRSEAGWIGGRYPFAIPTDERRLIMALCRRVVTEQWRGEGLFQVQVTALQLVPAGGQQELFAASGEAGPRGDHAADRVNERFGPTTLLPARLLNRSSMPDVIAPAWRPSGHRQTILDREPLACPPAVVRPVRPGSDGGERRGRG